MKLVIVLCAVTAAMAAPGGDWRIVDGEVATPGQFPYQVSVRNFGAHNCGGSILDEKTILLAAHCVDGLFPFTMTVNVGNNKLSAQTVSYQVSKMIPHKDYNLMEIVNDIAIIKLALPIKFRSGSVEPVKLRQTDIGDDDKVILSGWGTTSYPGETPDELQFIEMKTISVERCAKEQENMGLPIFDTEVCTVTKVGGGACKGDSGGPLVDENKEQVGIVSWGNPCAKGNPDVFTRVYSYLDWIEEHRK